MAQFFGSILYHSSPHAGGNTVQYYIDNGGAAADQPEIIDVEDGDEEIFPSLGPYQCEICQSITDTKQVGETCRQLS